MTDESLQDQYAPETMCFGCGPANAKGLRIKSRVEGDEVVLDWTPEPHHEAFPGFVNGGIIGVLFDCHCNWTAAYHLMMRAGAAAPPFTVTADYAVKLRRPTPSGGPLHLRARVVESTGRPRRRRGDARGGRRRARDLPRHVRGGQARAPGVPAVAGGAAQGSGLGTSRGSGAVPRPMRTRDDRLINLDR